MIASLASDIETNEAFPARETNPEDFDKLEGYNPKRPKVDMPKWRIWRAPQTCLLFAAPMVLLISMTDTWRGVPIYNNNTERFPA